MGRKLGGSRRRAHAWVGVVLSVLSASFGLAPTMVNAATTEVSCGDTAGLSAAIIATNGDAAADVINVMGAPCTFSITTPAYTGTNANNTGLPMVTQPLTINGNGATIQRSSTTTTPFRIFAVVAPTGALTLRDLVITGGNLTNGNVGAGVVAYMAPLTLDRVTLSFNLANGTSGGVGAQGAGLATIGGTLSVDRSTFAYNHANTGGAVATTLTPGTIRRSLFLSNRGTSTGAAIIQGEAVTLESNTFSANVGDDGVGGISVVNSGTTAGVATVASSTFVDNGKTSRTVPGGALLTYANGGGATINVSDTIISDSDSTATADFPACMTYGGSIVDQGGNLEWPHSTCAMGTHAKPQLSALEGNAFTWFYRPLPGSPVIELGGANCPTTDQVLDPRAHGNQCDAGAREMQLPDTAAAGPATRLGLASNAPHATFECRVDGAVYAACRSPFEPQLTVGSHTIEVRAVDHGYPDPTPVSITRTVETTPPDTSIVSGPSGTTSSTTSNFSFDANETNNTFECRLDADTWQECQSPSEESSSVSALGGQHSFAVRAVDSSGNVIHHRPSELGRSTSAIRNRPVRTSSRR